jgi:hypothetical protein
MRSLSLLILPALLGCDARDEFRGLAFGEPCVDTAERERALGSKVELRESDGAHHPEIRAIHQGREARVVYLCDEDNRLNSGWYVYDFSTYEEAAGFFSQVKSDLKRELGDPYIDSVSPEYIAAMRSVDFPMNDDDRYFVAWEFDSYAVRAGVSRLGNASQPSVTISYRTKRH